MNQYNVNIEYDRDEVYNDLIQNFSDESQDEITDRLDLIEFILENDKDRKLHHLKYQDISELDDMKETIINKKYETNKQTN